jgi:hypothetical protein
MFEMGEEIEIAWTNGGKGRLTNSSPNFHVLQVWLIFKLSAKIMLTVSAAWLSACFSTRSSKHSTNL